MTNSSTTTIGLDPVKSTALVEKLNHLLAMYQVAYMNTRGFHWNIRGPRFFELHLKFEELYNSHLLKIDEIAERILTLGGVPIHTFSDAVKLSAIGEVKNVTDASETVKSSLNSLSTLLAFQREVQKLATDAGDEGTNALMSGYIQEQEKLTWMYTAYLN